MNAFSNLDEQTKDLEQSTDRLEGEGFLLESDVYEAVVKAAYQVKSQTGAMGVGLILSINGSEYRETIYITNREGKCYYLNQNNKKVPMKGFTIIDDLCMLLTEKPLSAQVTEDKEVKIWNSSTSKEEPTVAPVITGVKDKKVLVAIAKIKTNKMEKNSDGEYVNTEKERLLNNIDKFFHPEYKCTYAEARDKKPAFGTFMTKWLEKNKGLVRDKYTPVVDSGVSSSGSSGVGKVHTSLFS